MANRRIGWEVREAFLARVAAGARPSAVAGRDGMPDLSTVNGWARRDPLFAAAYERAKSAGQWRREGCVAPAAGTEILRRLAEGEAIREILKRPGMPSRETYRRWRRMDGEFAAEVARINRSNREDLRGVLARRRWRGFERAVADKVIVRVSQGVSLGRLAGLGLPGPRVVARWRKADESFDAGLRAALRVGQRVQRRGRLCTPELVDAIFETVCAGASLAEVARAPGMPSRGTLYAWMRTRREFRDAIGWARQAQAELMVDRAWALADRPGWDAGRGRAARGLFASAERRMARARRDRGLD